jgi:site-specific DNA recombinase
MQTRYNEGASLARIGATLGYSAGTIRAHLLATGIATRDTHGR